MLSDNNQFDISCYSENLLSEIVDGLIVFEGSEQILFANQSACKIFGYNDLSSIVEGQISQLFPGFDFSSEAIEKLIITSKEINYRKSGVQKTSRTPMFLKLRFFRLHSYTGVFIRDDTKSRLMIEQLKKAREEAESANQAKSEFLANMSHEIRTPLNGILGMSDLLLRSSISQEHKLKLKDIKTSGESLLDVINEILDFSKIEAGQFTLDEAEINLYDIIDSIVRMTAIKAQEKGLEFMCYLAHGFPEFVYADPVAIRRVLINFLGNSVKFTKEGYILLKADLVRSSSDNNRISLRFSAIDTGIGLETDKIPVIFQKFQQADKSTTRKYGGTGLGLPICKSLIREMKGKLSVSTRPGAGSRFSFQIPVKKVERTPLFSESAQLHWFVLVKNRIHRELLSSYIKRTGGSVTFVPDSVEIYKYCDLLSVSGKHFDIAILDRKPGGGIDGVMVAQRLKIVLSTPPLCLLLTDQTETIGDTETLKEMGIDLIKGKPVLPKDIDEILKWVKNPEACFDSLSAFEPGSLDIHENPFKILLVEDQLINRKIAIELLEKKGFTVFLAENGKIALEKWRSSEEYDLILMDIQMPEMDGIQATQLIREQERLENKKPIPIIAMTAHAMKKDQEKALSIGMNDYLTKPLKIESLELVINQYYRKKYRNFGNQQSIPAKIMDPDEKKNSSDNLFNTLLDRLGGNQELVKELVSLFLEDTPSLLENMKSALDNDRYDELRRTAHRIVGTSANLGLDDISGLASAIENGEKNNTTAAELLVLIGQKIKDVKKAYDKMQLCK